MMSKFRSLVPWNAGPKPARPGSSIGERDGLPPPEPARTDPAVFLRAALFLTVLVVFNLGLAWVLEFYFGHAINTDLSFVGNDPSWIPKDTAFGPALGVHYFGDFEQYMGYARTHLPLYGKSIVYPPAYGPFAVVLVKVLTFLAGWPGAVFLFIGLSLVVIVTGFLRLMGASLASALLTLLLLCSGGMIIALDRGNLQLLVAGAAIWFCIGVVRNRPATVVTALVVAVAIKLYFALLVLVLLRARRWKEAVAAAVASVVVYLLSFLLISGADVPHSVSTFVRTEGLFASSPRSEFVLGCVSAASAVYKSLFLAWGPTHFAHFLDTSPSALMQVPGLVMAVACLAVIWFGRRPIELGLVGALAAAQLVPASTYPYLQINLAIELCLVLRVLAQRSPKSGDEVSDPLGGDPPVRRWILITCAGLLAIGCAPWMGMFSGADGATTPVGAYIGPIVGILTVFLLLGGLLAARFRGRNTTAAPAPVPPVNSGCR